VQPPTSGGNSVATGNYTTGSGTRSAKQTSYDVDLLNLLPKICNLLGL